MAFLCIDWDSFKPLLCAILFLALFVAASKSFIGLVMVASSQFVFLTLQSLFIPFSFIIQSLKIVVTPSLKQDALGRNLLLFSAQVFFQTGLFPHLFHALLLPLHTPPHTPSPCTHSIFAELLCYSFSILLMLTRRPHPHPPLAVI